MKKKRASSSQAFFSPRIILSFVLCSVGIFLTLLGSGAFSNIFAQPKGPAPDVTAPITGESEELSPADSHGRFVQLIEFREPGLLRRHEHASGKHFKTDTPQVRAEL